LESALPKWSASCLNLQLDQQLPRTLLGLRIEVHPRSSESGRYQLLITLTGSAGFVKIIPAISLTQMGYATTIVMDGGLFHSLGF
jgi:hypothetical protein